MRTSAMRSGARRRPRDVLAALVLVTALVGGAAREPVAALSLDGIRAEADWILTAQLPDGAIANYVDRLAVWPYLSNFAAMGLVRATEVTRDPRYLDAAWRWLSWYQAHQDPTGFVTDYKVVEGVPISTGDMDSTDAYAGTFLLAVRSAYRASGDRARLGALRAGIDGAVRAIEATQTADGLTWAKPSWKVKYLMDLGESYAGLLAGAQLARALGEPALAQRADDDARRMKAGVDSLWNSRTSTYDWAVFENGARTPNNWSYLYSDALQQAWAVAFGLTTSTRGSALMKTFAARQPNWSKPTATATFSGGAPASVGYWPVAGLGFSLVGSKLAAGAVDAIASGARTTGRAWPYTTGNAGQLIMYATFSSATSMLASLPASLLKPIASVLDVTATTKATMTTAGSVTAASSATTTTGPATTATSPVTTTTTNPPPPPATTTTTRCPITVVTCVL